MELWSEIFELAMPDREALDQLQGQSESEVPMSLTRTCRSWRQIAMAIPRIWTDIDIFITTADSVSPSLEVLKNHLRKSGNCPLNIALWGPIEMRGDWTMIELVLQTLMLEIRRWKTASLCMANINNQLLSNFLHLPTILGIETGAPLLESLIVYTEYYPRVSQSKSFPSCIPTILRKNAPVLRKFVFEHKFPLKATTTMLQTNSQGWSIISYIPYHQLTVLQLDGNDSSEVVTISEIITILQSSPNLVACRILQVARDVGLSSDSDPEAHLDRDTDRDSPSEGDYRELQTTKILLPNLKHLRLDVADFDRKNYEGYPLAILLDRFTTPALVSFTMCYDDYWDHAYFSSFIKRSGCTLQDLCIMFSAITSEDLIRCMRINPSLKVLRFGPPTVEYQVSVHNTDKIFRELLRWDSTRDQFTTCPVLEDFCMDAIYMPEKEPGEQCQVKEMIRARTGACGESFHFGLITDYENFPDDKHFLVWQEGSTSDSASADQDGYPYVN